MTFPILLALTGLTLSAVAIYYSVIGLTAVFAAAFWPIVVMGATLEVAKLVAASWLKMYWERIPRMMKIYMTTAVVVLMLITSMGIFGFLSKAHLDQNLVSGDVVDRVAIIDEKIKTERDNIEASRKALKQMDEAVDQTMARSDSERGAERAVQIRRQQQPERTRLQNDITKAQSNISKLNEERAPIAKDLRKVEAEVGPIKYIAKLIYGDNPDANILEKAVTWVIMIIVFVFDPLAVLMLLGAQMTYKWVKDDKENKLQKGPEPEDTGYVYSPWPFANDDISNKNEENSNDNVVPLASKFWPFPHNEDHKTKEKTDPIVESTDLIPEKTAEESFDTDPKSDLEKEARRKFKEENPGETIKHYEKLKDLGIISKTPWEESSNEIKNLEPEVKKKISYITKENNVQIKKTKEI